MRQQPVSRSCARAGSAMQPKTLHQDKDVSILLTRPTAILGMIGYIQVPTANNEIHRKRSHCHGTSTQLMTDAENTITNIPANFVELKKTMLCATDRTQASSQWWNNIHQHQDRKTLTLGFTEESLALTEILRLSQTTKDLFPNLLLFSPILATSLLKGGECRKNNGSLA